MTTNLDLPLDAFVRTIKVNRKSPHALFLGAGASISSNVLSAEMCIWEWKREIFLSNNPGLDHHFPDLALSSVQEKIQKWLDSEGGYPRLNSIEEYSFFVEKCYPSPTARRQFFQNLINRARPHIGYQMLCLLAEEGIVRTTWTTNFDQLTARAAAGSQITPIEIGLDTQDRLIRLPQEGELYCVALHGDYRYDSLKNTESELRTQDDSLRAGLVHQATDFSLIVLGYSGRDESIMETLAAAYAKPGTGILYWCAYGDAEPTPRVRTLLEAIRQHNREAYYVRCGTGGFDDVIHRLAMHCLAGPRLTRAKEIYNSALLRNDTKSPPFSAQSEPVTGFIKSNAFPITCPQEAYQFECSYLKTTGAWAKLRELIQGRRIVAGLLKQKVLALGTLDEINEAFKDKIDGKVTPVPINAKDLLEDNVTLALFRQAVVCSFAEIHALKTDRNYTVWLNTPQQGKSQKLAGNLYHIYPAARLSLRWYSGKLYLVIEPTVEVIADNAEEVPENIYKKLKNEILSSQYNRDFSNGVNEWLERLIPKDQGSFSFPPDSDTPFKFEVSRVVACATLSKGNAKPINITRFQKSVVWKGSELQEPELIFSNQAGDGFVKDINPLRGIVHNQPYDFIRHNDILGREIRLGIICPKRDEQRLANHLNSLHGVIKPTTTFEYLLDYPGFAQAFGLPMKIPDINGSLWVDCPEPDQSKSVKEGALLLRRNIITCINKLQATDPPNVILIYIPERWKAWKGYDIENEEFDLHDFVKADCVQKGIATQFLEEDTLTYTDQCRVIWFLSLALYAKAMRTPWILDSIDRDTAFIGLGYSHSQNSVKGKHVILGCSHLYNPEGVGLSYRLSKIEDPIFEANDWRQHNPFMSVDDARRVGESTRQLFFQSRMGNLPKRVVIHKRTPFRSEEKMGLLQGLSGVGNIDMLEITVEPDIKFVVSIMKDSNLEADSFPIRRGTIVVLDERRALLWAHGTTPAVRADRKYYLGKRRIPTPLLITRHYGSASLTILAREILGLSKMNWNNFDMYSKLPATIDSSNAIARIGSLLERYGTALHDYRLFM